MAFNPFHAFRKYRKVMFALLTIICMFVFILSGASGTFTELFSGKGRGTSLSVGSAYGRKITAQDLDFLRMQREAANLFILQALSLATVNAEKEVSDGLETAQMESYQKDRIKQILDGLRMNRQFMNIPQFRQMVLQQFSRQFEENRFLLDSLEQQFKSQQKTNEAALVQTLRDVLYQELNFLLDRGELYFRGGKENKDLIDFMIWRHQADRLGIQLTPKEFSRLVNQETRNKLSQRELEDLGRAVRSKYRMTPEQFFTAVADEFRVHIAQTAILGHDLRFYENPNRTADALTPAEFWNYYREKRTEGTVALLPIAVNQPDFLNKVGEPTEEELKELYEKNKYRLYDPGKEEAGFKQPTRYRLEWVRARPDAPHFQKATDAAHAILRATLPLVYEAALLNDYAGELKYQFPMPSWHKELVLHDLEADRPQKVASLVGQAVAAGGTNGWPALAGLLSYQNTGMGQELALLKPELRSVAASVTALTASGADGNPLTILGTILAVEPQNKYLPMNRIRPFLEEKYRKTLAKDLAKSSLKALEDELSSLGAKRFDDIYKQDYGLSLFGQALASAGTNELEFLAEAIQKKAEETLLKRDLSRLACAFTFAGSAGPAPFTTAALVYNQQNQSVAESKIRVVRAIEKYNLEHGQTAQARDQFDLQEDVGLEPLKTAHNRPFEFHQTDTNAKEFAKEIFNSVKSGQLYSPHRLGVSEEFLYWKIDEKSEYIPSFAEAKNKLIARWKFEKARKLAEEEARRIADQVPKNTTGEDAKISLLDKSKLAGALFELDHVAPLELARAATMSRFDQGYTAYKIPQSKVEYASAEMVNDLLGLKEEGKAIVVHDKPKANYYVAVLVRRPERYAANFKFEAERPDGLLGSYERDNKVRKHNLDSCLKQLRDEALLRIDEDALKKLNRQDRPTED